MGEQKLLLPSMTRPQEFYACFFMFTIEFGKFYAEFALESVFINPYFNRLNCSMVFISIIWLLPVILSLVLQPIIHKFIYRDFMRVVASKKKLSFTLCSMILVGILLFISAGTIAEWYFEASINYSENARNASLVLGVLGYLLMSTSHNLLIDMFLGLSELEKLKQYII